MNIVKQITEKAEADTASMVMQQILPKVMPMMKKAEQDFDDFLSGKEDGIEKTVVIRKFKDKPVSVIVLSNHEDWHIESNDKKEPTIFRVAKKAILYMFSSMEFIQTLMSGGLRK